MSADQAVIDALAEQQQDTNASNNVATIQEGLNSVDLNSTTTEEQDNKADSLDSNAAATASNGNASAGQDQSGESNKDEALTLRALVSSKEAGVIIGRGGQTIATIRTDAGVKAGVSKVVQGVADRILSVGGSVESVAKAFSLVAQTILENPVSTPSAGADNSTPSTATTTVRLLISHLLIGSVIGKGGSKIRQIQELSGVRMVASKEMLPQSTERIVEVTGQPEGIKVAVQEIAKCLLEDWERSQGTVLYHPGSEGVASATGAPQQGGPNGSNLGNGYPSGMQGGVLGGMGHQVFGGRRIGSGSFNQPHQPRRTSGNNYGGDQYGSNGSSPQSRRASSNHAAAEQDPNYREQKISIPADMVGCIIGRGGTKINEIRRLSGSRINIAKTSHDETGERLFVISGLPDQNEKALYLLYNQLELEKNRRLQSAQDESTDATASQEQQ